jgi:deoxyribonuclease-4
MPARRTSATGSSRARPGTRPARPPAPSATSRTAATTAGARRRGRDITARPLGAHQSIAGGLPRAVERAVETGCECLQIFTRNINRWDTSPIDPADAAAFRAAVAAAGLRLVVAHDSYLINPAAADTDLRARSIAGLVEELRRAELLGIPWVVAHPGAAGEQPVATAVRRAAEGIARALADTGRLAAGILIETTAGQGSCLGATFEEIAAMLAVIDARPGLAARVGVCLDTCHVFAAGYPLFPEAALDETLARFDATIGLDRLKLIHANDSKREFGSRVDRHEAIGRGAIGSRAFGLVMRHPRLASVPIVLETPKEGPDGTPSPSHDRRNLATLRRLARSPASGRG